VNTENSEDFCTCSSNKKTPQGKIEVVNRYLIPASELSDTPPRHVHHLPEREEGKLQQFEDTVGTVAHKQPTN
jgi:hypothetical protein